MDKDHIYKLINYQGEYNLNVKRALKKLLKDNHPDHGGDPKTFELINEVKNELEKKKDISYKYDKKSTKIKEDEQFYLNKIYELEQKRKSLKDAINNKKNELSKCLKEYKDLYPESLEQENKMLVKANYINKLNTMKKECILFIVLLIFLFSISVITRNDWCFIVFGLFSAVFLYRIYSFFQVVQKFSDKRNNLFSQYVNIIKELGNINQRKQTILKELNDLERKLNNIENDLRFYHNLLK